MYDEGNTRIKKITPDGTTTYVNQYYEIRDGEAKQFIYAGEEKVATLLSEALSYPQSELPASGEWIPSISSLLSGNHLGKEDVEIHLTPVTRLTKSGDNLLLLLNHTQPVSGSIIYNHSDHLSGSNIETDQNGYSVEELDYYPYGDTRIDKQNTTYGDDYKYTGKELDTDTGLYYYGARYYDPNIGRFTAIDPWSGDISDPQSLNKYAYVRNNPLKYVDPSGMFFDIALDIGFIALDTVSLIKNIKNGGDWQTDALALAADVAGAAIPFATGGGMAVRAARAADKAIDAVKAVDKAVDAEKAISKGSVVIGENMERVMKKAEEIGAEVFTGKGMEANRKWIQKAKNSGKEIIDIGPDFQRRVERRVEGVQEHSNFYNMERQETKNYENYNKSFQRNGKYNGTIRQ